MKERLKEFMSQMALNAAELADTIGVQRSSISHILGGRNLPSSLFIEKLLKAYPELDAGWLITGRGKMLGTGISATVEGDKKEDRKTDKRTERNDDIVNTKPSQSKGPGEQSTAVFPVNPLAPIERIIFFYADRSFSEYFPDAGVPSNRGSR